MVRDYAYVLGKLATLQSTCIKSALYAWNNLTTDCIFMKFDTGEF
jgi:hypothetical protein